MVSRAARVREGAWHKGLGQGHGTRAWDRGIYQWAQISTFKQPIRT